MTNAEIAKQIVEGHLKRIVMGESTFSRDMPDAITKALDEKDENAMRWKKVADMFSEGVEQKSRRIEKLREAFKGCLEELWSAHEGDPYIVEKEVCEHYNELLAQDEVAG